MLLKGFVVATALLAGAVFTLEMTNGQAAVPVPGETVEGLEALDTGRPLHRISMAPISIGNPSTATALASLNAGRPLATGTSSPAPTTNTLTNITPYQTSHKVKPGDTLARILSRAMVSSSQAAKAIRALNGVFNPRDLKSGQVIKVSFVQTPFVGPPNGAGLVAKPADRFVGFEIPLDYARRIEVAQAPQGGFKAYQLKRPLQTQTAKAQGNIDWSLFAAGSQAGVPNAVMAKLVRAFSWDVDFQRDIRKNDRFEVMYERKLDETGKVVYNGRLMFAALTLSGDRKAIYLHQMPDGTWDYFDDKGQSAKKALMRTPIDGARLSSSFGKRRHPILGYTKMHKGTDFAAPRGTPIYAAGDGIIEKSGRNGGYGNYIRIRHNSEYSTAYAHMKSIKRGRTKGSRVRQGQVIGYVGTTGRSTGPHLHYEILRQGRQVNPMRVKMPSGKKLAGQELANFMVMRDKLKLKWAKLDNAEPKLAQR